MKISGRSQASPIVLALGSNQGDCIHTLDRACLELNRQGIRPMQYSRIYLTRPLPGGPAGPDYMNSAITVQTHLRPLELLDRCKAIEKTLGRTRSERWAPRRIDIDLIFYRKVRLDHPRLRLPHPAWSQRDFVIAALLDLNVIPPGLTAASSRATLIQLRNDAPRCIRNARKWRSPLRNERY